MEALQGQEGAGLNRDTGAELGVRGDERLFIEIKGE